MDDSIFNAPEALKKIAFSQMKVAKIFAYNISIDFCDINNFICMF